MRSVRKQHWLAILTTRPKGAIFAIAMTTGVVMAGAPLVFAQSAQTSGVSADNDQLQEVVITAQRRSENLQTVPIAATAITGDQLGGKAVTRLADLQYASPSLTVTDAGLTQSVNIRGIGLASGSPAVANGVATYIDGLFQPPIVSTNSFFDIASVEVLRGPQGTLVGSNSTGGAIFINSQNPKLNEFGGYAELGYGNYSTFTAQGAVNIPVTDTFALRVAGSESKRDSFYTSVGPAPTSAGELNEKAARLGALWKPGAFQALFKTEYTDRNTGGYAYRAIPTTQYSPFAPPRLFDLDYDSPTLNHERQQLTDLELRYNFDNGLSLRSLSGYQDKAIHNLYDNDATAENTSASPRSTTDQLIREREWTEEINLISPIGGFYNWIVGAYVQRNKIDVYLLNNADSPVPVRILQPQKKVTTGWFGQLNFKLSQQLELQTGLRYSTFEENAVGSVTIFPGPPGGIQVANLSGDYRDGRPTGKVALNWTLDDRNLLYVFVARGYKGGGFNSLTSSFGPEGVWNYEAGWKATLLDGHVRTQLDAFYNQYSGFQFGVTDLSTGIVGVKNLQSTTKGVEGQIQAQVEHFQVDGGFAFVDSRLTSAGPFVNTRNLPPPGSGNLGPQCAAPGVSNPPTCFDYGPYEQTGTSGPNLLSPKWTLNLGAEYRIEMPSGASLTPRLNYAYVGSQWVTLAYSPVTDYLRSHGLLSALLTLRIRENWSIEGYGTNLANKVYFTGQSGNDEYIGAPRQYGVRASYRY